MKKLAIAIAVVCIYSYTAYSQGVAINETGAAAHGSAMLDVSSTTSGILVPRMPYLQRIGITSPATGLLVYQTNGVTGFYVYNGSTWDLVLAGTISIDDLSDGSVTGGSTYLGPSSGISDDGTNNYNVGIGTQSLYQNEVGFFNVAAGYQSLYNNTQSWHTAIGYQSYYNNLTGQSNTGLGFRSGYYNSTGSFNTLVGYSANHYNETGSFNTMVGFQAGMGSSTHNKSGNIFVGYQAGYYETGDNKLYIENSNSSTPLIYGDFSSNLVRVNGTFEINNAYEFPLTDGSSGQVLKTDGGGALSWSNDAGAININGLTDAKTGGESVFLGADAGASDNGLSTRNIALGTSSLYANDDGKFNAALGYEALYQNVTGDYNIALGFQALYSNTGSRHTAVGHSALYSNTTGESNTAYGHYAGRYNTTGNYNTLIGYNSNLFNQGGSNNTMIGYQAGQGTANHSKSGNVFLGYAAGFNETGNNLLYIENSNSSTPLIWGDFDADSVRINGDLIVTGDFLADIGINDLNDGKTTGYSLFLGTDAGANDDGNNNNNIGIGRQTLNSVVSGYGNVAIGNYSSKYLTGSGNTVIGYYANLENEGGENNVIIGNNAGLGGWGLYTASGNILIGAYAGYYNIQSDRLYIENSTTNTPLIYGEFDNDLVTIYGTLKISNQYSFPTTDGVDGQVMKTDGSGSLTWDADDGATNINGLSDGKTGGLSLFLGTSAGALDDGIDNRNVAIGDAALNQNIAGIFNVAAGYQALHDNTASRHTGIGYQTLYNNESGESNTGLGFRAAYENTSGSYNTAIGYGANYNNQTGSNNTVLGYQAGYGSALHNKSGSVFMGYQAGYNETGNNKLYIENSNSSSPLIYGEFDNNLVRVNGTLDINGEYQFPDTTGTEGQILIADSQSDVIWTANSIDALTDARAPSTSVYLGLNSGENDDDSDNGNAGFGVNALRNNTSGESNTGLGTLSIFHSSTGSGNTSVGYFSGYWNYTGSNNTYVGNEAGPVYGAFGLENASGFGYGATPSLNNRIHIGNTSITWIGGQVTWSTYSDERMKENVREDVKGLDFILKLRPVTYHVNKDKIDNIMRVKDKSDYPEKYDIEKITQSGFLAQEVEQAANESGYDFSGVHAPANENTPYSISYSEFVVPLVKAIQEQQELIEKLQQEIEELKQNQAISQ